MDINRNRQVSYYVNKEAMREMNNDDEDEYGHEISKNKGKAGNLAKPDAQRHLQERRVLE